MPSLLVKIGDGAVKRYEITRESVVIGRAETVDVQIDDPSVSRVHCQIMRSPSGRWLIQDFGSRNHTYVGDHEISKQELIHGDVIRVGPAKMVFSGSPVEGESIAGDTTIGLGGRDREDKGEFRSEFGGPGEEGEEMIDVSDKVAEMASGDMTMVPDDPLAALAEDSTHMESDECPLCGRSKLPRAAYCGPCGRKIDDHRQSMQLRPESRPSIWRRLFGRG